jgi:hypothetical protein
MVRECRICTHKKASKQGELSCPISFHYDSPCKPQVGLKCYLKNEFEPKLHRAWSARPKRMFGACHTRCLLVETEGP